MNSLHIKCATCGKDLFRVTPEGIFICRQCGEELDR